MPIGVESDEDDIDGGPMASPAYVRLKGWDNNDNTRPCRHKEDIRRYLFSR